MDFVFMLTRNDVTIPDARRALDAALAAGVDKIGFKDVGLPSSELRLLARDIRSAGAEVYLEVVSLDREAELASARAALDLGVDVLLGGTRAHEVVRLLAGSPIRYYPFPGRVVGHPSELIGSIAEIAECTRVLGGMEGVGGLDLLAYRFHGDVPGLMEAVRCAAEVPVLVAGSIDRVERIRAVARSGASAFTVGTAALEGKFPAKRPGLEAQLRSILRESRRRW